MAAAPSISFIYLLEVLKGSPNTVDRPVTVPPCSAEGTFSRLCQFIMKPLNADQEIYENLIVWLVAKIHFSGPKFFSVAIVQDERLLLAPA